MAQEDFINENLTLYLKYEYLTADQCAKIITATNGLYNALANSLIYGQLNYISSPYIVTYPIPLCLKEVYTGNSIDIKFSFSKRFFPSIKIEKEAIDIILPQWTAVLILAGLILTYGMDKYKDYLDIRLKQMELNEKTKAHVNDQSKELNRLNANTNNANVTIIQQNIYLFQSQIYQPNINEVQINRQKIYEKNAQ